MAAALIARLLHRHCHIVNIRGTVIIPCAGAAEGAPAPSGGRELSGGWGGDAGGP